jgi:hypothetical protein
MARAVRFGKVVMDVELSATPLYRCEMRILGILLFIFQIIGCENIYGQKNDDNNIELLKKEWVNSYEEKIDLILIYRSSDFTEFPPSRFRKRIIFLENNIYKYLVLAPNDAHYYKEGIWEYDEKLNILLITTGNNNIKAKFNVLEITENLLKLECNK